MTVRSRTVRAVIVTAASALAVVLATSPAQADFGRQIHGGIGSDDIVYGAASFVARGDSLVVCDGRRDGYSVTVDILYSVNSSRVVNRVKASGKGKCVREDWHDVNLKEGHTYAFWAQAGPGGSYRMAVDKA